MSRLRVVVPGDDGEPVSFADAARAAMERVLAKGAIALTIIYETSTQYLDEPVPHSKALTAGLIEEFQSATDAARDD